MSGWFYLMDSHWCDCISAKIDNLDFTKNLPPLPSPLIPPRPGALPVIVPRGTRIRSADRTHTIGTRAISSFIIRNPLKPFKSSSIYLFEFPLLIYVHFKNNFLSKREFKMSTMKEKRNILINFQYTSPIYYNFDFGFRCSEVFI